jgi:S1-C subfamily serine protease
MAAPRPSISRDTRWLLIVVAVSLTVLSITARVRYGGTARVAGPIAPVLSQLNPRSPFETMSAAVDQLLPRLRDTVLPLPLDAATTTDRTSFMPAVRFREGFVVGLVDPRQQAHTSSIVATDRVTQLVVARSDGDGLKASPMWEAAATSQSRFVVAVTVPSGQVVARPLFVAAIDSARSPRWPSPIWTLRGVPPIAPGTLIFTLEGALAGVIVNLDSQPVLVPPSVVMSEAERVLSVGDQDAGLLDLDVQALSGPLQAATGAPSGVVISGVSPSGPSAGHLKVGDVILDVDGVSIASIAEWDARLDRILAGQVVALTVWRAGERVTMSVVARGDEPPPRLPLGLQLRTMPRLGARIERALEGGAAHRAGLRNGDVLTRVGNVDAPTAAQAERALRTAPPERPLLVGVTRGETHFVVAMDRRW